MQKTHSQLIDTAQRRAYVLKLRVGGKTFRQIAKSAIEEFGNDALPRGWDERYAYKDVDAELKKLREEIHQNAEDVFELNLQRYNGILAGHYPKAVRGDSRAAGVVLRTLERIEKLYGLDVLRADITTKGESLNETNDLRDKLLARLEAQVADDDSEPETS